MFFSAWQGFAAAINRYVATNGAHLSPFTNWSMAGTNISVVVSWANSNNAGDTVWVSNGVYLLDDQINVTNTQVKGWSGNYADTIINGNNYAGKPVTNRCFYLNNTSALVAGLTISNGFTLEQYAGAGLYICYGTVSNCLITDNVASNPAAIGASGGGGIFLDYSGKVVACVVRNNSSKRHGTGQQGGGGIDMWSDDGQVLDSIIETNSSSYVSGGIRIRVKGMVSNCVIRGNSTSTHGGGLYIQDGGRVYNSTIINNRVSDSTGAGVSAVKNVLVQNCIIVSNVGSGANTYGGGVCPAGGTNNILRNCVVAQNTAAYGGGIGVRYGPVTCLVENCSIASNRATVYGGGLYVTNAVFTVKNTIIYFNIATTGGSNWFLDAGSAVVFSNCCLSPTNDIVGSGNIAGDPQLVNLTGGNLRLHSDSPCVNAGLNQDWMTNSYDLDGRMRVRYGTVDIGAYETIYEGTIYKF